MENLTRSLAALAILALREGKFGDAARLLGQAAVAPDSEKFLEDTLAHNLEARVLIESCSSAEAPLNKLGEAVEALSSALESVDQEDDDSDEVQSMSYGNELADAAEAEELNAELGVDSDYDDDIDAEFDDDDQIDDSQEEQEEETGVTQEDDQVVTLSCSSIKLHLPI